MTSCPLTLGEKDLYMHQDCDTQHLCAFFVQILHIHYTKKLFSFAYWQKNDQLWSPPLASPTDLQTILQ